MLGGPLKSHRALAVVVGVVVAVCYFSFAFVVDVCHLRVHPNFVHVGFAYRLL